MATHKPVEIQELYGDLSPAQDNQKWEVVYTKPKREKKLAEYALEREINYFLPLFDSVRKYKYRQVKFTKPLFPGYMFVKCSYQEKETLIRSGHILTFLQIKNEKHFLQELSQIYLTRVKGVEIRQHKFIEEGTKVIIKKGNLEGLKGYVIESGNPQKIILKVNILRQAVAVTIDPNDVKVLKRKE